MRNSFFLIALCAGWLATPASAKYYNAMLCETEEQAIEFALAAQSKTETLAQDAVAAKYGKGVCGRYVGNAEVLDEKTQMLGGGLYMLAALRFVEDQRVGWTASWVAPFDGNMLRRRAGHDVPLIDQGSTQACWNAVRFQPARRALS